MFSINEIAYGKLIPHIFTDDTGFVLEDISHLIVYPISQNDFCVINSFQDKSFIIPKNDWKGIGTYPTGFSEFVKYPEKPLQTIDLPRELVAIIRDSVSFIIVLSYDCNLRCKYCYQQCNLELNRNKITSENLTVILDTIERYHTCHPEKHINIELFGGEPLLVENYDDIIRIFDFCVNNCFSVSITTNGVNIPFYLKDLVIYSGLNMTINTTLDSISSNEITRFSDDADTSSSHILKSIYTLINNDIQVLVQANIDQHNINQIGEMIEFYRRNDFLNNKNFMFTIARVDDRRFETGYDKMVTDAELIAKLMKLKITEPNVYFSFVKSSLALCKKLDPNFRQHERKYISNYCWASAPLDNAYYVDADLDVFRCTFTVGRKEYSQFKFSLSELENFQLPNRTYLDYPKCQGCPIGGYCSGGCALSADVDFERMCSNEKDDFNHFLQTIYYPQVKLLMGSVGT